MTSTADFLHNNRGDFPPTFKFAEVGAELSGVVTRTNLHTGPNLNNEVETSLVLNIADADDKGHSVWVKAGSDLIRKLHAAAVEAKPGVAKPTIEEGDKLSIRFDHTEPASKKGYSDRKIFEITLEPGAQQPTAEAAASGGPSPEDLV